MAARAHKLTDCHQLATAAAPAPSQSRSRHWPLGADGTLRSLTSLFNRSSGVGSLVGRRHARAMLVEAAWAAAKAAGPLRAFFIRIRAHQVAAVAVARKLAVLCWHLLTKQSDYLWARPALVANKKRSLEFAGRATGEEGKPARIGLCLQCQGAQNAGDEDR
jgi:hypothetical protein